MHLVNTTSTALVRDLLSPLDHPAIRWFSSCTHIIEASTCQRSGLCRVCPAFSIDSAPLSLLVPQRLHHLLCFHQTSRPRSSALPGPHRRRHLGLPARTFPDHDRLRPLDLDFARVFCAHLELGCFTRLLVSGLHCPTGDIVSMNTRPAAAPCCVAGPVGFSESIGTGFVVVRPPRGSSSCFGFMRLCCSKIPSNRPQHSALCMPVPLEQREQPIVRPCSLTKTSVTYQRF